MSDRILYINSNLSFVPWEGRTAAAAAPISPPTPGHYHVLYRGCGETQVGWHGETYCLVGGYRAYGDAPVASLEKAEAEKPVSRRNPKRHHALEGPDKELGATSPKVLRRWHRVGRNLPSQEHSSQAAS
ncbi:DPEP2 neighbor protein [Petaurus breviceps papuanus]|uniref:DPEP2 neighbor protein n=1 Tax=Petaurus breviceps papuanus TaxID=3040969 RepID=UPI0036DE23EA